MVKEILQREANLGQNMHRFWVEAHKIEHIMKTKGITFIFGFFCDYFMFLHFIFILWC